VIAGCGKPGRCFAFVENHVRNVSARWSNPPGAI
jgi:hypothetical protein